MLVSLGQWVGVEVRVVESVSVPVADRPNTDSEKVVMAVVWVSVVCLCVLLAHLGGEVWPALEVVLEAMVEEGER